MYCEKLKTGKNNMKEVHGIFLSRRNLLTLLSKLDRASNGDQTECTILKMDNKHPKYAQSMDICVVTALEDDVYYCDRIAGEVHPLDTPEKTEVTSALNQSA